MDHEAAPCADLDGVKASILLRRLERQCVVRANVRGEARKAGLSETSITTLKSGASRFDQPDEQAIHDYATEILTHKFPSDPTFQRIVALFGMAGAVELTGLIGYYAMVALMLNAADLPLPPELPSLPPRG